MKNREENTPIPQRRPADRELHYHYNREERERNRTVVWTPPSGGFFRRNRALAIVLVDVIIVVLLFFIYLFFLRPLEGRIRIDGYRVNTQVYSLSDGVLVTVTVVHDRERTGDAPGQPLVSVESGERRVADLAPLPGRERAIALNIPRRELAPDLELTVTIRIGDAYRVLSLSIPQD